MKGKMKIKEPEIVLREGKPVAVLIDIDEYERLLERLDDMEDLKILEEMRKRPLAFKKIDEFLMEYNPDWRLQNHLRN